MGPEGTPASLSIAIHSALDFADNARLISSFSAARFLERLAPPRNSSRAISSSRPIALANLSQITSPEAPTLMWPSLVLYAEVGMLVGWSLPARFGTSPSTRYRAAV